MPLEMMGMLTRRRKLRRARGPSRDLVTPPWRDGIAAPVAVGGCTVDAQRELLASGGVRYPDGHTEAEQTKRPSPWKP